MILVGALSLNQTPLDWDHNLNNIIAGIQQAKEEGVQVLCCPELCITGYGCEDAFFLETTHQMAFQVLQEIIPHTQQLTVAVGLPVFYQNNLYNCACLIEDQKIVGFVPKQNLANEGVYYEFRWFKPWPKGLSHHILINDQIYPIGDLVFDVKGIKIGFEICEDAWVLNRTGIELAKQGVDLILNPSASHFEFGKSVIRQHFVQSGASDFQVGYIYANLLGNEAGRLLYDGDTLIAAGEEFLKVGPRFSFQDYVLSTALIDVEALRFQKSSVVRHENIKNKNSITSELSKEEEFTKAVTLGLYDYLRKSHAQGFVINLSGGADSSSCVCLVYLMVYLGIQELGLSSFLSKLNHVPDILTVKTESECLEKILYCLYQATSNSSFVTETAAFELTRVLGISFEKWSVDKLVTEYTELVGSAIGRSFSWDEDDIALQNIQSRVRTPSAWLLANLRKSILICTSNRSEASVGYATMDGDVVGGLAPLAGIDKPFILKWLKWLEEGGIKNIGSIPALKKVTIQAPTAELRPLKNQQTDEEDLMPYEWLNSIEYLFIHDKKSPVEILKFLNQKFPNGSLRDFAISIERFFTLWGQNQWKRERLPPSFHLGDHSVDPKTWCRFPIISGGFKREIKALWEYVESCLK